jgi:hypothetical protein
MQVSKCKVRLMQSELIALVPAEGSAVTAMSIPQVAAAASPLPVAEC